MIVPCVINGKPCWCLRAINGEPWRTEVHRQLDAMLKDRGVVGARLLLLVFGEVKDMTNDPGFRDHAARWLVSAEGKAWVRGLRAAWRDMASEVLGQRSGSA